MREAAEDGGGNGECSRLPASEDYSVYSHEYFLDSVEKTAEETAVKGNMPSLVPALAEVVGDKGDNDAEQEMTARGTASISMVISVLHQSEKGQWRTGN